VFVIRPTSLSLLSQPLLNMCCFKNQTFKNKLAILLTEGNATMSSGRRVNPRAAPVGDDVAAVLVAAAGEGVSGDSEAEVVVVVVRVVGVGGDGGDGGLAGLPDRGLHLLAGELLLLHLLLLFGVLLLLHLLH